LERIEERKLANKVMKKANREVRISDPAECWVDLSKGT
jgi:hypothetical protein